MLGELRTTALSPQKYYELYMHVWSELRDLRIFFGDKTRHGRTNLELYELVQHAGNILPRLYLLITVGAVYIESKEGSAKDVLKDLVEMTKGVQHPIHGLFLRAYLSQESKDLLPDEVSSSGADGSELRAADDTSPGQNNNNGGDVTDSVDFVLQNFTEMNKLWVRMAHGGAGVSETERREKERRELRDLVGKNLHVLSSLESLDLVLYKTTVLPKILEQIVNCKDDIAQPYLMDAVVQVFPDDFHVETLQTLLNAVPKLKPSVNVGDVLASLMDRLTQTSVESPELVNKFSENDALAKFQSCIGEVVAKQPTLSARERLRVHASLMHFAVAAHRDRLELVDGILDACADALGAPPTRNEEDASTSEASSPDRITQTPPPPMIVADPNAVRQLLSLLTIPLDTYDVVDVLSLRSYPRVMRLLQPVDAREMAVAIAKAVLKSTGAVVTDTKQVDTLFNFLSPLLVGGEDENGNENSADDEDFCEEQNLIARVTHRLRCGDLVTQFDMLKKAKAHFEKGGPFRMKHTLPPLAFVALRLGRDAARENSGDETETDETEKKKKVPSPFLKSILQFLHQVVTLLAHVAMSHEHALFLFLESARLADRTGADVVAVDFLERAMGLYEEEIVQPKKQKNALALIVGTLQRCVSLDTESKDGLIDKTMGFSARLLKKPDRVSALASCAHLRWGVVGGASAINNSADGVETSLDASVETSSDANAAAFPESHGDPADALSCLTRATKIATAALEASQTTGSGSGEAIGLLVTALNSYLWFFENGCVAVDATLVSRLVEQISHEVGRLSGALPGDVNAFLAATLRHVQAQKTAGGAVGERYRELTV
tara:strand:- start:848 stop:3355 length:2508 start_codon:yes stop_codon:yes gene_type:complete